MKAAGFFAIGAICGAAIMAIPRLVTHLHAAAHGSSGGNRFATQGQAHTREQFEFTANGTMEVVAPLFGADRERVWAPGWNPRFLFPLPPADREGMVFVVGHDRHQAIWLNTEFDPNSGRVQYAYVIPGGLVTRITLRLTPVDGKTHVSVTYERTALSAETEEQVRRMAESDRAASPEWERQINAYLEKSRR